MPVQKDTAWCTNYIHESLAEQTIETMHWNAVTHVPQHNAIHDITSHKKQRNILMKFIKKVLGNIRPNKIKHTIQDSTQLYTLQTHAMKYICTTQLDLY